MRFPYRVYKYCDAGNNFLNRDQYKNCTIEKRKETGKWHLSFFCHIQSNPKCYNYPEEATIKCLAENDNYFYSIMAIPCNGKIECYDGRDEVNCKTNQSFVLPLVTFFVILAIVCLYIFVYGNISDFRGRIESDGAHSKKFDYERFLDLHENQQLDLYVSEVFKLEDWTAFEIFVWDLFDFELQYHQRNKSEAVCCIKVCIHY